MHQTKRDKIPENFEKVTSDLNKLLADQDECLSNSFNYFGFFHNDDAKSFPCKIEDLLIIFLFIWYFS